MSEIWAQKSTQNFNWRVIKSDCKDAKLGPLASFQTIKRFENRAKMILLSDRLIWSSWVRTELTTRMASEGSVPAWLAFLAAVRLSTYPPLNRFTKETVLVGLGDKKILLHIISRYETICIVLNVRYHYIMIWNKCFFHHFKGCITVKWCKFLNLSESSTCFAFTHFVILSTLQMIIDQKWSYTNSHPKYCHIRERIWLKKQNKTKQTNKKKPNNCEIFDSVP